MSALSKDARAKQIERVLQQLDLPPVDIDLMIGRLRQSDIIDDFLFQGLTPASTDLHILLLTLTGIVSDPKISQASIDIMLSHLQANFERFDDLDTGIYWHLTGYQLWRNDKPLHQPLHHLNNSSVALVRSQDHRANHYLARVHDTLGQLSYSLGNLEDALIDFQTAVTLRPETDQYGRALTLGNLGRAHMDLGNWGEATQFFKLDLKTVEKHFDHLTQVKTQLLSHLGYCHLEGGDIDESEKSYRCGWDLAVTDNFLAGKFYCAIGLGKIAVCREQIPEALKWKNEALQLVEEQLPVTSQLDFKGHIDYLSGLIHVSKGELQSASRSFENALDAYQLSKKISPIEMASLLLDFSQVSTALDDRSRTADLLAEALSQLDSTSAIGKRRKVEAQLKDEFRERWILHASRRLNGGRSFEELLDRTGEEGFSVEKHKVAVMFADIRGFTKISEGMDPEELIAFLNAYLSSMIRSVNLYEGYVVQVLGDAIMAVFTLPENRHDDADRALKAAMLIVEENRRLNFRNAGKYPSLQVGVGLHYGESVSGLIGSPLKRSYTQIGDVVNTASRLEGLTKILGSPILVSEEICAAMIKEDHYLFMPMGSFVLYGREEPISVSAAWGMKEGNPQIDRCQEQVDLARLALTHFQNRSFAEAEELFLDLEQATGIAGFQFLADQAKHFQRNSSPDPWSGAIELDRK